MESLEKFFDENRRVALAMSGGTDSAYLLYEGLRLGADVRCYYVRSQFQPDFELEDAERLMRDLRERGLDAKMSVLELDVLADERIACNPSDRCFFCKKKMFGAIIEAAHKDGYDVVIDGTNASDAAEDRPGMRATAALGVRSPLRAAALTKPEIRRRSEHAGLFTATKPAYACLATRVLGGERITAHKLATTQRAENFLSSLGFSDFRIRLKEATAESSGELSNQAEATASRSGGFGNQAVTTAERGAYKGIIQIRADQLPRALGMEAEIRRELGAYYSEIIFEER